jgi:hypothetical protein
MARIQQALAVTQEEFGGINRGRPELLGYHPRERGIRVPATRQPGRAARKCELGQLGIARRWHAGSKGGSPARESGH